MAVVLLDTCAMFFLANGDAMAEPARQAIRQAVADDGVLISAISAWEIGMIAAKGRMKFVPNAQRWLADFLERDGVGVAPLTIAAALDAGLLPSFRGDPADRIMIATAQHLNVPIITRDGPILAYAKSGHVKAIRC
jgi:PIN domain nuclease of toxin-antitoxin system